MPGGGFPHEKSLRTGDGGRSERADRAAGAYFRQCASYWRFLIRYVEQGGVLVDLTVRRGTNSVVHKSSFIIDGDIFDVLIVMTHAKESRTQDSTQKPLRHPRIADNSSQVEDDAF